MGISYFPPPSSAPGGWLFSAHSPHRTGASGRRYMRHALPVRSPRIAAAFSARSLLATALSPRCSQFRFFPRVTPAFQSAPCSGRPIPLLRPPGHPTGRRRARSVAAAGPGLCERDRGGAGAVPLHGMGKKQLLSLFGFPLLCAGGGPGEIRRRKIPVWLDRGRGGGIRNAQPAGGVRADPPAHVVAVHRDPGR